MKRFSVLFVMTMMLFVMCSAAFSQETWEDYVDAVEEAEGKLQIAADYNTNHTLPAYTAAEAAEDEYLEDHFLTTEWEYWSEDWHEWAEEVDSAACDKFNTGYDYFDFGFECFMAGVAQLDEADQAAQDAIYIASLSGEDPDFTDATDLAVNARNNFMSAEIWYMVADDDYQEAEELWEALEAELDKWTVISNWAHSPPAYPWEE